MNAVEKAALNSKYELTMLDSIRRNGNRRNVPGVPWPVTHVAIEHLHIAPSAWATAVFTAHCPGCRGHLEENK